MTRAAILHDWPDAEALAILRRCRLGMDKGARLLIIERLLGVAPKGGETELSDLNMLINAGGRERSKLEFADLLDTAGFTLAATYPLPHGQHLIEALPVGGSDQCSHGGGSGIAGYPTRAGAAPHAGDIISG